MVRDALVAAVFLFGMLCVTLASAAPGTAPAASPVQIRLVANEGDAGAERARVLRPQDGEPAELPLEREVLLDASHIESAEAREDEVTGWSVYVSFTDAGSERLAEVTRDNIGRRLAVVVDGKIVTAPVIQSQIRGSAQISGGPGSSRADAEELAAAINAAAARSTARPAR